jgi:predicted nucleic acid-binding protein
MVVNALRLIDADIFAYFLYDESPAHKAAWEYMINFLQKDITLNISPTTILETYNTLYWYYKVRPIKDLIKKITLTLETLNLIHTSVNGLKIAATENIPLSDGLLISTAMQNKIPVIVSNDKHIASTAQKYGIIHENPITPEIRDALSEWSPLS